MRANVPAAAGVPLRLVLMPTEHGGWSFLGEPILLGLIVAFSPSGFWLSLAAIAGFFARQPLRLFVADHRRGKLYPRSRLAARAFLACAALGAVALAFAWVTARGPMWIALALGAPVALFALSLDLSRRSRELGAELGGAIALGAVAAGIALGAGRAVPESIGLWVVCAARAIGTIPFVRARLRLERGEPWSVAGVVAAQLFALALTVALARASVVPAPAALAMALLAARAAWGLSPLRPRLSTAMLGVTEIAAGLVTIALVVWGLPRH